MLEERIRQALKLVAEEERTSDYSEAPLKTIAVRKAISLSSLENGTCLDLGSEGYTRRELEAAGFEVEGINLSDGDMHDWVAHRKYNLIFARHVLEHSPFPLYMLLTLKEALENKGEMIVVVPEARGEWILKHPAHVSVLPKLQWEKLFTLAGFEIKKIESGSWTPEGHTELRYLLV